MTRALIVVLVAVFALGVGLAACTDSKGDSTNTSVPSTTTTSAVGQTTSTAAPETTTTTVEAQEPITIRYATTFQEAEAGGKIVRRFCDYVEDKTAGAVTFDIFFGGVVGNSSEELGLVSSGSVDMISFNHRLRGDQVPLLNFPMWASPDAQAALDYYDHLVFKNPSTSALIQAEAAANNIIYLGFTCGGGNVFISKEPFSKLSDLIGKNFGANRSLPAFERLGYTVVQTSSTDTYEKLAEGAIDATQMSFAASVNLRSYEIAKHYMWDGTYTARNVFSVNLDTWAKLTQETRALFYEAAEDAETLGLELDAVETEAKLQVLKDAGVTLGTLSTEDRAAWWKNLFEAGASDCMTRAQKLGIVDSMSIVLKAAGDFAGVEWTPPAE